MLKQYLIPTIEKEYLEFLQANQEMWPSRDRALFQGSSENHSAYIASGNVYMFGENQVGELGFGDTVTRYIPTELPGVTGAVAVGCGDRFTVIVKSDGTAVAMGRNTYGQLGDGTTVARTAPTAVALPVGFHAREVVCGGEFCLFLGYDVDEVTGEAVASTRAVCGFGRNDDGQLADSTPQAAVNMTARAMVFPNAPGLSPAEPVRPMKVSVGAAHSVVVDQYGTAWLAGSNYSGQLGYPTDLITASKELVVAGVVTANVAAGTYSVVGFDNVLRAEGGTFTTAVVTLEGALMTVGLNEFGELGTGSKTQIEAWHTLHAGTPGTENGRNMLIGTSGTHLIFTKPDSTTWGVGSNAQRQLSISGVEALVPVEINTLNKYVVRLALGRYHTLALLNDGYIYATGQNEQGQVGRGQSVTHMDFFARINEHDSTTPDVPVTLSQSNHSGALLYRRVEDNRMVGSGNNQYGILGIDALVSTRVTFPHFNYLELVQYADPTVTNNTAYTRVSMGSQHAVALDAAGVVWTWGVNDVNQLSTSVNLGLATPNMNAFAVDLAFLDVGETVRSISAAGKASYALTSSNRLFRWGTDAFGSSSTPSVIPALSGIQIDMFAVSDTHIVILANDDRILTLGSNEFGALGTATNFATATLVTVTAQLVDVQRDIMSVSAGRHCTAALTNDGFVYVWGTAYANGRSSAAYEPLKLLKGTQLTGFVNLNSIVDIACGDGWGMALAADGLVFSWGTNDAMQLGIGADNVTPHTTPRHVVRGDQPLPPLSDSIYLNYVNEILCAAKTGYVRDAVGRVYGWGKNSTGQLAQDNTTSYGVPKAAKYALTDVFRAPPYSNINVIESSGSWGSVALKSESTDAQFKVFGRNDSGKLATGDTVPITSGSYTIAHGVFASNPIVSLSLGSDHSAAVTASGLVYAWGNNASHACGQPDASSTFTSPTLVPNIPNGASVACGYRHTLVLLSNKTIFGFGLNSSGQLGLGHTTSPVAEASPHLSITDAVWVLAGHSVSIAYTVSGKVFQWGDPAMGGTQSGTPVALDLQANELTQLDGFESIRVSTHAVAVKDGLLYTWGSNEYGQLGRNTDPYVPTSVPDLDTVVRASAGYRATAILLRDGTIRTIGFQGTAAALSGSAITSNIVATTHTTSWYQPLGPKFVYDIHLSRDILLYKTYATSPVALDAFGAYNAMTAPPVTDARLAKPRAFAQTLLGGHSAMWRSGSLGGSHTALIDFKGDVYTTGANSSGQLGQNNTTQRTTLAKIALPSTLGRLVVVAHGSNHTLALNDIGELWSWGDGIQGQLGHGSTTSYTLPTKLANFGNIPRPITGLAAGGQARALFNFTTHTFTMAQSLGAGRFGPSLTQVRAAYTTTEANGWKDTFLNMNIQGVQEFTIPADGVYQIECGGGRGGNGSGNPGGVGRKLRANFTLASAQKLLIVVGQLAGRTNMSGNPGGGGASRVFLDSRGSSGALIVAGGGGGGGWVVDSSQNDAPNSTSGNGGQASYSGVNGGAGGTSGGDGLGAMGFHCSGNSGSNGSGGPGGWCDYGGGGGGGGLGNSSATYLGASEAGNGNQGGFGGGGGGGKGYNASVGGSGGGGGYSGGGGGGSAGTTTAVGVGGGGGSFSSVTSTDLGLNGTVDNWDVFEYGYVKVTKIGNSSLPASSAAITDTGDVYMWGSGASGQLGQGASITSRTIPSLTTVPQKIVHVVMGDQHTVALASNGTVWAFGKNAGGQLGLGNTTDQFSPVQITSLGTETHALAAGGNHTIALKRDGSVWAWGSNGNGQLGLGNTTNQTSPAIVTISVQPSVVVAVSCGSSHSVFLHANGLVTSVGSNDSGQCGDGSSTQRSSPVAVSTLTNIVAIAAGAFHTYALTSSNIVYAFGGNGDGQLGDGTTTNRTVPVVVSLAAILAADSYINFTGQHRCFIKNINPQDYPLYEGLCLVSDQDAYRTHDAIGPSSMTINQSLPIVSLSTAPRDKRVFGVLSTSYDMAQDPVAQPEPSDTQRTQVNSVGEGALWVIRTSANPTEYIQAGDYLTTSSVPGYAMRQTAQTAPDGEADESDEFLRNYTVAKTTMACDFDPDASLIMQRIVPGTGNVETVYSTSPSMIDEHVVDTIVVSKDVYDASRATELLRFRIEPIEPVEPTYYFVDDLEVVFEAYLAAYAEAMARFEVRSIVELDAATGDVIYPPATEPRYRLRYVRADGTHASRVEYDAAKAASNADNTDMPIFVAAFVGCTYHCG